MLRLPTCLLTVGLVLVSIINAQVDLGLCPDGPTTPIPDPKWRTIPHRFEIVTEYVANNEIMELSQAFSPQRDAIASASSFGPLNVYWNFVTNEQFSVLTAIINNQPVPQCLRQEISVDSETSVVQPNTLLLKPSVLLGFDPRNQPNPSWGIRFEKNDSLRGIPTNIFKSCFYVTDIKATVAVTYHVSDVTLFHAYLPANESILLKLDVQVKNQAGKSDAYTYNIFRYTPNPSRREERQALETPAGVFCPNRKPTLPVPTNIPERVSSNSEAFVAEANRSIFSTHGLYDIEFQFTRSDVWFPDPQGGPTWGHFTEMHDFATGLSYQYIHATRQCSVRDITPDFNDAVPVQGNPNLVQMGAAQHLFLMDDIIYHYTGEKRCHDRVWCHVWIGEKPLPNNTIQHREWYWASSINGEPVQQSFPMKLILKTYVGGAPINSYEMNIFNYRRNPMTILEIDYTLSDCYRALGPAENYNIAVLSFVINNDKNYPVFQNLNYLRLYIYETLSFTLFVRPIRLANLVVDKDGSNITVTFTLLDAPPRTGPVENPLNETKLDPLIERLNSVIDSNALVFRAKSDAKQVTLRALPKSLNIKYRSSEINWKSTGPRITGFWIGFIVVGLLLGAIGGFFVFQKLAK